MALDAINGEADEAVVDENRAALVHLARQLEVVEVEMLGGALELLRGLGGSHRNLAAGNKRDLGMALKEAGANLGTLGVEQDAHGDVELAGDALHALHAFMVLFMAAMAEVEAGDVHARKNHLTKDVLVVTRRSHGAYDLGALVHEFLHLSRSS